MCCDSASGCRPTGFLTWLASWLTFPVCPLISAPLALVSVIRSARSGSGLAMTRSTLLSPFVLVTAVVAGGAIRDYTRGRAVLHDRSCIGMCDTEARLPGWSIDARTRLPIVRRLPRTGAATFIWRVNDRVARAVARILGPQRGAYAGALPTRESAASALAKGSPVGPFDDLSPVPDIADLCWRRDTTGNPFVVSHFRPLVPVRKATLDGLTVFGTGPDFFVLVDPVGNREVARYGDPAR